MTPGDLEGRRVLLLNWRDRTHPDAGGAEVYCHELGGRLVEAGAEVTLVTSRSAGAEQRDVLDGMTVVRRGGTFGVYLWVALFLVLHGRRYDAVIDCQNGIPFFSPLFGGRRAACVLVIHHVHQEQFSTQFPRPVAMVGRFLERTASRWVYGTRPIIAVSPSTRAEVRQRLGLSGPIHVVPNGSTPLEATGQRADTPTITCISRLVPHKRLELLLDALPEVLEAHPDLTVHIAGSGPESGALVTRCRDLGLDEVVTFHGRVSDDRRTELISSAWLTVVPSSHEGWGLTVIEANSVGVPAVAFEVAGLKDSIIDGRTGWVAPEGPLAPTAIRALHALRDPAVAERMAAACRSWSAQFSWDRSADRLARIVAAEVDRRRRTGDGREPSDLAVVVELEGEVPGATPTLPLRRTDLVERRDGREYLVLHGCDELEAMRIVDRMGVWDRMVRIELADPAHVLGASWVIGQPS